MLDKKMYESHEVVDKLLHVTADTTLTPRDLCVRVYASETTGPLTVTLANVSECRGLWVSIAARDGDATNTVTIQDQDESEFWAGDITMNGPGDTTLLYSDGYMWHQCCSITSGAGTSEPPTTQN